DLKRFRLGEHIAENEASSLPGYFLETASYRLILEARQILLVGRKGAGKTANLLRASDTLKGDKRNLVCVVKPVSYELEGVLRLLSEYKARDSRGYLMESIWKYLLLTEIAQTAITSIRDRYERGILLPTEQEAELLQMIDSGGAIAEGDFSIRLERSV